MYVYLRLGLYIVILCIITSVHTNAYVASYILVALWISYYLPIETESVKLLCPVLLIDATWSEYVVYRL